jgi:hypothetical protein
MTDVPSVSWSLTVTEGLPPETGTMGVTWPPEARNELHAVKTTNRGITNSLNFEIIEFLFMPYSPSFIMDTYKSANRFSKYIIVI